MAVKTFTDPDALAEHLGERLASEVIHGKVGGIGMADQFLHDLASIKACEAGEPVIVWDA
ncbi:hypothetical protein J2S40_001148 [Nocardioides luteus]|uniref:Uncharacterized protein n=1 Tax=Nocardioides luteus TaxID=1844 RepID=A0ABQ5SS87_9ACTN|nr:hypothetical protein [Nocardioides luteus]MDR7310090.1 hypothetical protein [Nocardioides luteus]GGR64850.1 hypothetical protein GCM10010197_35410 [Nocardioides luteus]GLJ67002.1 hypothetical protein GCM10017579_10380 [Nocardioides luteus]